ncbi:unnamed protein product [Owenia fusiformis]|uniref:Uncharacterized protein n=1 Tax=Owenia fusiformis TaxID=6347 RepID=A0A8J1UP28_OWEFU|nr:unnamed protein product [Owenia fusiformis]
MGIGNILQLTQVTLYLLAFIFCWFIWLPVASNLGAFNGHCLLYADGKWAPNKTHGGDLKLTAMKWGDSSSCTYPIFVGIISAPISLFYLIWVSIWLYRERESSWLASFLCMSLSMLMSILMFAAGLVLTIGFNVWCSLLMQNQLRCDAAGDIDFEAEADVNTHGFYIEYGMAQFGAWTSWLCWVTLSVLSLIRLYQYHQQEDFLITNKHNPYGNLLAPAACCRSAAAACCSSTPTAYCRSAPAACCRSAAAAHWNLSCKLGCRSAAAACCRSAPAACKLGCRSAAAACKLGCRSAAAACCEKAAVNRSTVGAISLWDLSCG